MFVQRDFLIRQIEQLTAALARLAVGQPAEDDDRDLDEADAHITRAVGLGLDIAARLPPASVASLVDGDPQELLALGLALARHAWRDEDPARARSALQLIDHAATLGAPIDDHATIRAGLVPIALG